MHFVFPKDDIQWLITRYMCVYLFSKRWQWCHIIGQNFSAILRKTRRVGRELMREKNKNRLFVSAENDFRKMYKSHIRMIYLLITTEKHASSYSSQRIWKSTKMSTFRQCRKTEETIWNCHTRHQLRPHIAGNSVSLHLKRFIYHLLLRDYVM